jgi:hypothetical protein
VQRILTQADVRPHRLERYLASDDPDFENKAADVIGLYLAPPQHAAVFCVDEKTAIQALDRLDPVLPCHRADWSATVSNTAGMALCRCMPRWM